ncbi:hypothetical protein TNCV_4345741 [Trichonephila clavipes]|nr:hypothetical protein TNCV_4345741 [Trichonephila clavipes]
MLSSAGRTTPLCRLRSRTRRRYATSNSTLSSRLCTEGRDDAKARGGFSGRRRSPLGIKRNRGFLCWLPGSWCSGSLPQLDPKPGLFFKVRQITHPSSRAASRILYLLSAPCASSGTRDQRRVTAFQNLWV